MKNLTKTILIIITLLLSGLTAYLVIYTINNPLAGPRSFAYLLMTLSSFLGTLLAFQILKCFIDLKNIKWTILAIQILCALLLPPLLTDFTEEKVNQNIIRITEENFYPVIRFVEEEKKRLGHFPCDILAGLEHVTAFYIFEYNVGDRFFSLNARVPSIDMDGATIYFDYREKKWYSIHNDLISFDENSQEVMSYNTVYKELNRKAVYKYNRLKEKWTIALDECNGTESGSANH